LIFWMQLTNLYISFFAEAPTINRTESQAQ